MLGSVTVSLHVSARPRLVFATVGGLTGVASAFLARFVELGDVWAPAIGGYCFGFQTTSGSPCHGVDAAMYLFPGLVFGVTFGPLLQSCRIIDGKAAVAYAAAATLANAFAVFVFSFVLNPITALVPGDLLEVDVAVAGILGGAAGGGALSLVLRRFVPDGKLWRQVAAAATLGALVALVMMFDRGLGVFPFYLLWQAGYAAALAASLPAAPCR